MHFFFCVPRCDNMNKAIGQFIWRNRFDERLYLTVLGSLGCSNSGFSWFYPAPLDKCRECTYIMPRPLHYLVILLFDVMWSYDTTEERFTFERNILIVDCGILCCALVGGYQRFERTYRLHLQGEFLFSFLRRLHLTFMYHVRSYSRPMSYFPNADLSECS